MKYNYQLSLFPLILSALLLFSCDDTPSGEGTTENTDSLAQANLQNQTADTLPAPDFDKFIAGFTKFNSFPHVQDTIDITPLEAIAPAEAAAYVPGVSGKLYYGPQMLVNESFYLGLVYFTNPETTEEVSPGVEMPAYQGAHLLAWSAEGDTLAMVPNVYYFQSGTDENGEPYYQHTSLEIGKYLTITVSACEGGDFYATADSVLTTSPEMQTITHYTVLAGGIIREDYQYALSKWRMKGIKRDKESIISQLKPFDRTVFEEVISHGEELKRYPEDCDVSDLFHSYTDSHKVDTALFAIMDSTHFPVLVYQAQEMEPFTVTGIWLQETAKGRQPVILARAIGEKVEYAKGVSYYELSTEEYLFPINSHNFKYYSLEDRRAGAGNERFFVNQLGKDHLPIADEPCLQEGI